MYCLRVDVEKIDQPGNPGNFLAMLKLIANYDPTLKGHLEHPRQRNATYISPRVQNEIIDIIGKNVINKSILDQIRRAKCFSIMVDEVTSNNTEVIPLCISFIDSNKCIREKYIQFSTLVRVTGEVIATKFVMISRSLIWI